jgi:hypothetical protein
MKPKLLYLLGLIFILACNKNEKQKFIIDNSKVSIIKYNPQDLKNKLVFSNAKPADLTNEDLFKIENALEKVIAELNIKQVENFKDINSRFPNEKYRLQDFLIKKDDYKRQYLTVLNTKGEKEVFINLISNEIPLSSDWKTTILRSHGGGKDFFSLKINLNTGKYYDVWVNAEA